MEEKTFQDFYKELSELVVLRRYGFVSSVVKKAKVFYRQGGFQEVASGLREFRDNNRWRTIGRAILSECDNWGYAMKDLDTAIQLAEKYSKNNVDKQFAQR